MSGRRLWRAGTLALCLAARLAAAPEAARGAQLYVRCQACHALAYDRVGPHHCGLFGRLAGSVPDFSYSAAMKRSKIVWNDKTLDRFPANPLKTVPGRTMTHDGVPGPKQRADLIACLRHVNNTSECAMKPAIKA